MGHMLDAARTRWTGGTGGGVLCVYVLASAFLTHGVRRVVRRQFNRCGVLMRTPIAYGSDVVGLCGRLRVDVTRTPTASVCFVLTVTAVIEH